MPDDPEFPPGDDDRYPRRPTPGEGGDDRPEPGVPPTPPVPDARPGAGPSSPPPEDEEAARARRKRVPKKRTWLNVVLFVTTLAATTYWGFIQYQAFYEEQLGTVFWNPLEVPGILVASLPYGLAVIAFLLAHEMGHYLACRYYGLDATLPYFIPMVPHLTLLPGTMGAVIRILSPIRRRRALFDIAVAGPLAGFVVALPILATGMTLSRVVPAAQVGGAGYLEMGEPLIWGPLEALFAPPMGPDADLLVHPLAFVGWFALLVTAMNLLPVGQLDGGHILYAFLPGNHRRVSIAMLAAMLVVGWFYFPGWIVFALVIAIFLGTRHPPLQTFEPLGTARQVLAVVAVLVFVGSIMLVPVRVPNVF